MLPLEEGQRGPCSCKSRPTSPRRTPAADPAKMVRFVQVPTRCHILQANRLRTMNVKLPGLLQGLWMRPCNLEACCGFAVNSPRVQNLVRGSRRVVCISPSAPASSVAFSVEFCTHCPSVPLHIGFLTASEETEQC